MLATSSSSAASEVVVQQVNPTDTAEGRWTRHVEASCGHAAARRFLSADHDDVIQSTRAQRLFQLR